MGCGCTHNYIKLPSKYEGGGYIDAVRAFTEDDYKVLIDSGEFKATFENNQMWTITKLKGGRHLGKWHKDKEVLYIIGNKDLSNPLVKWLKDNLFVSNSEKFKLEDGGGIEDEYNPEEDLFQNYDKLPKKVQRILAKYSDGEEYSDLENALSELEPLGYTFDYGLDAVPYNLRKIKMASGGVFIKGKNVWFKDKSYKGVHKIVDIGKKASGFKGGYLLKGKGYLVSAKANDITDKRVYEDGGIAGDEWVVYDCDSDKLISVHKSMRSAKQHKNKLWNSSNEYNCLGMEMKSEWDKIHSASYSKGGVADFTFEYQMLDRLRLDNDAYLDGVRVENRLWAGSVDSQIQEMKRLWNIVPEKPEWLSMEDILEYERKMKSEYENGGGVSDLQFTSKTLRRSIESKVRANIFDGEIPVNLLKSIIGHEPDYPVQFVGSLKLTKSFLRPYYKI